MRVLLENPLPIAVVGALLSAFALVVFFSRRNLRSLVALGAVLAVTFILLAVERFIVTDREQVETGVAAVLAAVEANDADAVLTWIDSAATAVRDAQALMPLLKVEKARVMGAVEVEVNDRATPSTATSRFRGFLTGVHSRSGTPIGYVNQQVDVAWIKRGDRWLIEGYTAYFDGKPIDAVGSARGNRPLPSR